MVKQVWFNKHSLNDWTSLSNFLTIKLSVLNLFVCPISISKTDEINNLPFHSFFLPLFSFPVFFQLSLFLSHSLFLPYLFPALSVSLSLFSFLIFSQLSLFLSLFSFPIFSNSLCFSLSHRHTYARTYTNVRENPQGNAIRGHIQTHKYAGIEMRRQTHTQHVRTCKTHCKEILRTWCHIPVLK